MKKETPSFNWTLFILALLLTIFGVLMVYDSSSADALRDFHDKFYFLKDQVKWAALGITLGLLVSRINYRVLFSLSPFFLLASMLLLVLVFVPGLGIKAYGASRWLDLRFIIFQPAELTKLAFIIYLSAWFSVRDKQRLSPFFLLMSVLVGLITIQPDVGTALILAGAGLVLLFLSDVPIWKLLSISLVLLPILIVVVLASSYRVQRLRAFLHPERDPLGSSYQMRQSIIAVGSGGLFGLGLGGSRQKYSYLPEATTDAIFAIIAEELGTVGVSALLLVFVLFIGKGLKLALAVKDKFAQLLIVGIFSWISLQTLLNLGSTLALFPLTGVPLPFISYGGSALVVQWLGLGVVLSIGRNRG